MNQKNIHIDLLDDWKSEFLPRLQKSHIYRSLKEECIEKDSEVISLTENAVAFCINRAKSVIRHMDEYTLHDDIHLFRVLYLMERLLTKSTIESLSVPEKMLLILSAFFHDIGMSPDEKEIVTWRKVWDKDPEIESENELFSFNKFKRFCDVRPSEIEALNKFILDGHFSKAETIKSYLITDFIRQTHAERVQEIIAQNWDDRIKYRDTDLTVELANICQSHNQDALKLLDFDKSYSCGNDLYACLPLIGVALRLADILDFDGKRTPAVLFSHLFVRNPVSISEWQKHRAIENWEINPNFIQFSAKCTHPAIEASIHEFCDMIDHELSLCNNIISIVNEFNVSRSRPIAMKIPFKVSRDKIETKKNIRNLPLYTYRDTKFNLSKRQVIDLLMGTKLYGSPEVALRELLQNSIDACLLRKAQEFNWGYSKYEPEIVVKYYAENGEDILEVTDNGTGMDQYIIDNYYSKVGSSFYKSIDFYNLKSESRADFTPTSRFGIGILSCFMVADTLLVDTKRVLGPHKSSGALSVAVEGQDSVFWIRDGSREVPGTTTKLILRKVTNPWEKMSEEQFIASVERVVPNPPFNITIVTAKIKKQRNERSFEEVTAKSLVDKSWGKTENIRIFESKFSDEKQGFVGSALVAVLESQGRPVDHVDLKSRDIEIEGKVYTLTKNLTISNNSIEEISHSVTVTDDGEISQKESRSDLAKSKSLISLHGIEIPASLFPFSWMMKPNQVKLNWPFPLIVVIDICGARDLDLTSARTEIVQSEKWTDFEEELAFNICNDISKNVDSSYWDAWKHIVSSNTQNKQFLDGLNRVQKTSK